MSFECVSKWSWFTCCTYMYGTCTYPTHINPPLFSLKTSSCFVFGDEWLAEESCRYCTGTYNTRNKTGKQFVEQLIRQLGPRGPPIQTQLGKLTGKDTKGTEVCPNARYYRYTVAMCYFTHVPTRTLKRIHHTSTSTSTYEILYGCSTSISRFIFETSTKVISLKSIWGKNFLICSTMPWQQEIQYPILFFEICKCYSLLLP